MLLAALSCDDDPTGKVSRDAGAESTRARPARTRQPTRDAAAALDAGPDAAQSAGAEALIETTWQPLLDASLSAFYRWLPSQGRELDPAGVFAIDADTLHILGIEPPAGDQEFGYLATKADYADYRFRFEQRWGTRKFAPRAEVVRDSGLLYHVRGDDRIWPTGIELQVQEHDIGDLYLLNDTGTRVPLDPSVSSPTYSERGPEQPLRASRVIKGQVEESLSDWNAVELIAAGRDFLHLVNGRVALRGTALEYLEAGSWQPLDRGRIALQAEGAEVFYRNVALRPLSFTPPPEGSQVLFGGQGLSAWEQASGAPPAWQDSGDTLEIVPGTGDLRTTGTFGDFRLHLEFKLPATLEDAAGEQDRGNSGVFLQGRYELQVLDSFGRPLEGENDAGAIYGQRNADSNEALPAEVWQSYDIVFHQPVWQGDVKQRPARVSVVWNGTLVHRDVEIEASIGDPEAPTPGPLRLQDHGHRVRYRNIWLSRL